MKLCSFLLGYIHMQHLLQKFLQLYLSDYVRKMYFWNTFAACEYTLILFLFSHAKFDYLKPKYDTNNIPIEHIGEYNI